MPVEVKILSRVLVNRLRPHIAKLVHPDQKGFIPGRRIDQQIMLARDLHHLETSLKRKGLVTFLDFAKAYDRVNRPYLLRVLERQGFGPRFLAWIRLLYSDSKCSLMINGWAQDSLTPTRGVKQGDPLSPYLFALSLEPLGNLLRARRDLGVLVDQTLRVPVGFFADDTDLGLS
ncbi:reverse transcriptase [Phytophthora megakarya]|uniref:Reverse transcriptase n=1 Tax=Phytophthora megakarya TaxID=4795 RepID=A0A225WZD3_9STRA|nr:reverse transcriptase [Phytophthora megakarya]